jgi:hypothetical protein
VAPVLEAHFAAAGQPVTEIQVIPPSLEDVFIERIGEAASS